MSQSSTVSDPADHVALRALVAQYAAAVDRRDRAAFAGAFAADGLLEVYSPDAEEAPARRWQGHDELGAVTKNITRYDKTFHFLGQSTFAVEGDEASGETYCIAHHLTRGDDGATDKVMYIRYDDRYRRIDGEWRITWRRLHNDWVDAQRVDVAG